MSASTRYVVEWTPWKLVRAAAEKHGWTENDSAADFVDLDDFTVTEPFPTFAAALRRAHMVKIHDTWGCPRVERQNLVNDHDDMGNTYAAKLWEPDARWEVMEGRPDPVETAPDVTLVAAE